MNTKITKFTRTNANDCGVDYSDLRVDMFTSIASTFHKCSFQRLRSPQVCFGGGLTASVYHDCDFTGSRFGAIAPGIARFERCRFEDVRIKGMFCQNVEFIDCIFSGVMEKIVICASSEEFSPKGVRLGIKRYNEIRGNDFSRCRLVDFDFRFGVDVSTQKLPEGPEYIVLRDVPRMLPRLREVVHAWNDEKLREKVCIHIETISEEARNGQRDQFITAVGNTLGVGRSNQALVDLIRTMQHP